MNNSCVSYVNDELEEKPKERHRKQNTKKDYTKTNCQKAGLGYPLTRFSTL